MKILGRAKAWSALVVIVVGLTVFDGVFAQELMPPPADAADPALRIAPMEPERIAPQSTAALPDTPVKSGAVTYLQYNYLAQHRPCTPVLVLDVPQSYARRSPQGPTKVWQVALLVRFRQEDNAIQPATPDLFGCVGHCDGRMTLMISNGLGDAEKELQRSFHSTEQTLDRLSTDDRFVVGAMYGGQVGFKSYMYVKNNHNADEEYYSDSRDAASASYMLRCLPHVPVPACDAYVSLPGYQWVDIKFNFDMLNLPIWDDDPQLGTVPRIFDGAGDRNTPIVLQIIV